MHRDIKRNITLNSLNLSNHHIHMEIIRQSLLLALEGGMGSILLESIGMVMLVLGLGHMGDMMMDLGDGSGENEMIERGIGVEIGEEIVGMQGIGKGHLGMREDLHLGRVIKGGPREEEEVEAVVVQGIKFLFGGTAVQGIVV
jgi:hypothetical protein